MTQNQQQPEKPQKARQVIAMPFYVVVEEDAVILPSATAEFIKPSELPMEGNFYALTADGVKISKDTGIIKAVVPAQSAKFLANVEFVPKLLLPKIPPLIIERAWRFFQTVFGEFRTEAELMLMYNAAEQTYDLWCPTQEVSMAGVDYKMSAELQQTPPEWDWVGTIHSHADFSPYHSGIDHRDEQDEDGVHITIGFVDDEEYCSLCASVMIGGRRWRLPPENIALGLERTTAKRGKRKYYISTSDNQDYFDIVLSDEQKAEMEKAWEQINREWMPRVTEKIFQNRSGGVSCGSITYEYETYDYDDVEENGEWCLINGQWEFLEDVEDDDAPPIQDTDLGQGQGELTPEEIAELNEKYGDDAGLDQRVAQEEADDRWNRALSQAISADAESVEARKDDEDGRSEVETRKDEDGQSEG